MSTDRKAVVKFLKHSGSFNPGERAGFKYDAAASLVRKGVAVLDDEGVTLSDIGIAPEKTEAEASALVTTTHAFTVEQCIELVAKTTDLETLQAYWEGEGNHPNHEGGRKGVLQPIRARAEELKAIVEAEAEKTSEAKGEEGSDKPEAD